MEPEQEQTAQQPQVVVMHRSKRQRFRLWYTTHKKLSIPLTALVLLIILAAIPWSRYQTAGLVLKNEVSFKVTDATASTPVSGAQVSIGNNSGTTDGDGMVTLSNIAVGQRNVTIAKAHYQDQELKVLVPIMRQKTVPEVSFVATGRQVKVVVKNLITQKTLADADIKLTDSTAKTDKGGEATVVLAANAGKQEAVLSLPGYNDAKVTIEASAGEIKQNDFTLTPAGKVYFLSKLSGRIDVVKTNLDGTERKTVLRGTGSENDADTILLASKDWKYVALLADRTGSGPGLYVIDTDGDQLSTVDQSRGNYTPIGWQGDYFVYALERRNVNLWRAGKEVIKSYQASSGKLVLLNQAKGTGTHNEDYAREVYDFGFHIINGSLVFAKSWEFGYESSSKLDPAQAAAGIYTIGVDGKDFKSLKTFGYEVYATEEEEGYLDTSYLYFSSYMPRPNQIYYSVYNSETDKDTYYKYSAGQFTEDASLSSTFEKNYDTRSYTYMDSPSGEQIFWAEPRDGKNMLFVAGSDGTDNQQVATLSNYEPYGWYSEDYLLVTKNGSELFVIPAAGIEKDTQAVKITDYHKPDYSYYGYGYGGY